MERTAPKIVVSLQLKKELDSLTRVQPEPSYDRQAREDEPLLLDYD